MASLNKVFIIGNLTRDVELKYTPGGDATCELNVAVNEKYTGRDGSSKEETAFIGVEVWKKQAENCAKYLSKGSLVLEHSGLKLWMYWALKK